MDDVCYTTSRGWTGDESDLTVTCAMRLNFEVLLFITAVPNTKLRAWGEEGSMKKCVPVIFNSIPTVQYILHRRYEAPCTRSYTLGPTIYLCVCVRARVYVCARVSIFARARLVCVCACMCVCVGMFVCVWMLVCV